MEENKPTQVTIQSSNPAPKKKDPLYITIIVLLLLASGFLFYQNSGLNNQFDTCSTSNDQLKQELITLNEIFNGGSAEQVSKDLKENLKNMISDYDMLIDQNTDLSDSLYIEKERIQTLLDQVDSQKKDIRALYRYKKEAATLREIMKGYVHTIDSLHTLSENLRTDLQVTQDELGNVTQQKNTLETKSKDLEGKIAVGSILTTTGFVSTGIKVRTGGKQVETTRANRSTMLKTCFTIGENKISKSGPHILELRVIDPSGNVLTNSKSGDFEFDGSSGKYSESIEVDYQNQELPVCIYFDLESADIVKGNYIFQVFSGGHQIGKDTYTMK